MSLSLSIFSSRSSALSGVLFFAAANAVAVACSSPKSDAAPAVEDDATWPTVPAPAGDRNFNTENLFPNYTIFEHGKDCYEAMDNHPLPRISCLEGTLLPVHKDGVEYRETAPDVCDKPDLVDPFVSCIPGARIRVQESEDKQVVSVFMCRRTPRAKERPIDVNDPTSENIAIFQYNRRNNNVCWFQIRKHETGVVAVDLVNPYEPGRQKGDLDDQAAQDLFVPPGVLIKGEACVGCHDSQVFVRTPHVQQAKYSTNPADRLNTWSDDETLHGRLVHVGLPFKEWNEDKNQPKRIRIDLAAYDAKYPMTKDEAADFAKQKLAPADACTSCHSVGKSPLKPPHANEGSCDNFVREWADPTYHGPVTSKFLSDTAKQWPNTHWMPPEQAKQFATRADFERHYRRALRAIKRCCLNPDLEGAGSSKICLDGWAKDQGTARDPGGL